jgi:hypothetical protein
VAAPRRQDHQPVVDRDVVAARLVGGLGPAEGADLWRPVAQRAAPRVEPEQPAGARQLAQQRVVDPPERQQRRRRRDLGHRAEQRDPPQIVDVDPARRAARGIAEAGDDRARAEAAAPQPGALHDREAELAAASLEDVGDDALARRRRELGRADLGEAGEPGPDHRLARRLALIDPGLVLAGEHQQRRRRDVDAARRAAAALAVEAPRDAEVVDRRHRLAAAGPHPPDHRPRQRLDQVDPRLADLGDRRAHRRRVEVRRDQPQRAIRQLEGHHAHHTRPGAILDHPGPSPSSASSSRVSKARSRGCG